MYVTICVEDCKNPDIKIEPEQIIFHGVAGLQQKLYEITIPLFGIVEPEVNTNINKQIYANTYVVFYNFCNFFLYILKNSKTIVGGRYIELVLLKPSNDTKYWPHLTKEKKKYHWLKVDFKKWKDEDDSDDETAAAAGLGPGLGGDANIDDV